MKTIRKIVYVFSCLFVLNIVTAGPVQYGLGKERGHQDYQHDSQLLTRFTRALSVKLNGNENKDISFHDVESNDAGQDKKGYFMQHRNKRSSDMDNKFIHGAGQMGQKASLSSKSSLGISTGLLGIRKSKQISVGTKYNANNDEGNYKDDDNRRKRDTAGGIEHITNSERKKHSGINSDPNHSIIKQEQAKCRRTTTTAPAAALLRRKRETNNANKQGLVATKSLAATKSGGSQTLGLVSLNAYTNVVHGRKQADINRARNALNHKLRNHRTHSSIHQQEHAKCEPQAGQPATTAVPLLRRKREMDNELKVQGLVATKSINKVISGDSPNTERVSMDDLSPSKLAHAQTQAVQAGNTKNRYASNPKLHNGQNGQPTTTLTSAVVLLRRKRDSGNVEELNELDDVGGDEDETEGFLIKVAKTCIKIFKKILDWLNEDE